MAAKMIGKALGIGCGLFLIGQAHAYPISTGEIVQNGGFGSDAAPTLSGWTSKGAARAGNSGDAINGGAGNFGFDGFFGSSFAVLGDESGPIGDIPFIGLSRLSQRFTLGSSLLGQDIENYALTLSFRGVFDGDDSELEHDLFSVSLNELQILGQDSTPLPDCRLRAGRICAETQHQIEYDVFSTTIYGLQPGEYTLSFTLDEIPAGDINPSNTAVGIDDVSLKGVAYGRNPPHQAANAVPEPGSLPLLGIAAFALATVFRFRPR